MDHFVVIKVHFATKSEFSRKEGPEATGFPDIICRLIVVNTFPKVLAAVEEKYVDIYNNKNI